MKTESFVSLLFLLISTALAGDFFERHYDHLADVPEKGIIHQDKSLRQKPLPITLTGFETYYSTKFYLVRINHSKDTVIFKRILSKKITIRNFDDEVLLTWSPIFKKLEQGKRYKMADVFKEKKLKDKKRQKGFEEQSLKIGENFSGHQQSYIIRNQYYRAYIQSLDYYLEEVPYFPQKSKITLSEFRKILHDYNRFDKIRTNLDINSLYYFLIFILTLLVEYAILHGLLQHVHKPGIITDDVKVFSACLLVILFSLCGNWLLLVVYIRKIIIRFVTIQGFALFMRGVIYKEYLKIPITEVLLISFICTIAAYFTGLCVFGIIVTIISV